MLYLLLDATWNYVQQETSKSLAERQPGTPQVHLCSSLLTLKESWSHLVQCEQMCKGYWQLSPSQILKIAGTAGGHINPAVTLGFFIAGRISFIRGLLYTICQALGAAVGAALIRAVRPLLQWPALSSAHKCTWVQCGACEVQAGWSCPQQHCKTCMNCSVTESMFW